MLTTTAAWMELASATTSSRSISWGMGAGSTVAVTTKTSSMLAATGPGASAFGDSPLQQRGAGLHAHHAVQTSPVGSGSSRTRSPTTTRGESRLALPRSTARTSPAAGVYPVDRAVPLQHGAEEAGHQDPGAPGRSPRPARPLRRTARGRPGGTRPPPGSCPRPASRSPRGPWAGRRRGTSGRRGAPRRTGRARRAPRRRRWPPSRPGRRCPPKAAARSCFCMYPPSVNSLTDAAPTLGSGSPE